ncbi:MAG TPA: ammonium transporter, partial [Pirellulales bacterium]|nr:ammonium transporter [Pirellulales bacterium]
MFTLLRANRSWWALVFVCTAAIAGGATRPLVAQERGNDAAVADPDSQEHKGDAAETRPTGPPADVQVPDYFTSTVPEGAPAKWPDPVGANSGVWATPAGDKTADVPSNLKPEEIYDRVVHNMFSINMCWTLLTGALVMFMQAGFSMVEGGLSRQKNACHTWSMNFMIYPLGGLGFWVYGFAIGWGNWFNGPVAPGWYPSLGPGLAVLDQGVGIDAPDPAAPMVFKYGLLGTKGFFLHGVDDVGVMALFFFMMVFMDTTATIPTGAMAERWHWWNFVLYGCWVALPYCVYANWVWGGGWLAQAGLNWQLGHGAVDFAGSGVVHAMGGLISLAGCIVLGPRIGKYVNGKPQALPGHNIPMVVIGTFILAFGWFGFNPGSTLSGTDLRIASIFVNTMLSSFTGAVGAMLWMKVLGLRPDPSMMCNGMLAGLVAITAPCAFVDCVGAVIIGLVAGVLCVLSVFTLDKLGVDDVVGAISVHGTNGIWGVISVGLFATGKYGAGWNKVIREEWTKDGAVDGVRGLFYGDLSQLWAQLLDAGVLIVFG